MNWKIYIVKLLTFIPKHLKHSKCCQILRTKTIIIHRNHISLTHKIISAWIKV